MNGSMKNILGSFCLMGLLAMGCKKSSDTGGGGSTPQAGGSGDAIIVGEYASLTGNEAAFGRSSHRGTVLAIEELNKAGGVLGKQLRLVTEDTQSKGGESSTVVSKLISREKAI